MPTPPPEGMATPTRAIMAYKEVNDLLDKLGLDEWEVLIVTDLIRLKAMNHFIRHTLGIHEER